MINAIPQFTNLCDNIIDLFPSISGRQFLKYGTRDTR